VIFENAQSGPFSQIHSLIIIYLLCSGNFSPHYKGAVNISQLSPSAREAVLKFLINQNITLSIDGILSQEDLCNDTRNSNEPLAVGEPIHIV
jgi:hypothetical protein